MKEIARFSLRMVAANFIAAVVICLALLLVPIARYGNYLEAIMGGWPGYLFPFAALGSLWWLFNAVVIFVKTLANRTAIYVQNDALTVRGMRNLRIPLSNVMNVVVRPGSSALESGEHVVIFLKSGGKKIIRVVLLGSDSSQVGQAIRDSVPLV